jgi:hypothetical protein
MNHCRQPAIATDAAIPAPQHEPEVGLAARRRTRGALWDNARPHAQRTTTSPGAPPHHRPSTTAEKIDGTYLPVAGKEHAAF